MGPKRTRKKLLKTTIGPMPILM